MGQLPLILKTNSGQTELETTSTSGISFCDAHAECIASTSPDAHHISCLWHDTEPYHEHERQPGIAHDARKRDARISPRVQYARCPPGTAVTGVHSSQLRTCRRKSISAKLAETAPLTAAEKSLRFVALLC